jgi:hypothetical protein
MTGALSIFTATKPATLGKQYRLTSSGVEKTTAGEMTEGVAEVVDFDSVQALVAILAEVGTHQAISASFPKYGQRTARIVTKAAKPNNPGALARTKEDFGLPPKPGVLILDYDPPEGAAPMGREHLWGALRAVVPQLETAGVIWWCSGSSFIYNGDEQVHGLRGQRLYVTVQDLSDTERFGDVLSKRLWLAGHGRVEVSASGQKLLRTIVDGAMFQAARLDFCGGAVCVPPLEQRRGSPVILAHGGWLDSADALPDLTPKEQAQFEAIVADAKAKAEPAARAAREKWQAERIEAATAKLTHSGVAPNEAAERAERALSSALGGVLLGDFTVTLDDGQQVTVGEALDNKEKYHGRLALDPLEPEYQGGKVVSKFYLFGSAPNLHSFAHGGKVFQLRRQPARLYVAKGRKAEVVDDIRRLLNGEPDLFIRGGVPVKIEGGRVRCLRKHSLQHLVQTRVSFYSRTDKGVDARADLPGDVVEMLLATLEG